MKDEGQQYIQDVRSAVDHAHARRGRTGRWVNDFRSEMRNIESEF